ncbi:MAG: hypothetical protein K2Y71_29420 [Xanthobacteraceae bacterium]|nr:hypothetical protein [Xanthobacteraceae bacterium]
MSSSFGRKIQAAIDHLRGKERQVDPADAWGMARRDARKLVRPTGALKLFSTPTRDALRKSGITISKSMSATSNLCGSGNNPYASWNLA